MAIDVELYREQKTGPALDPHRTGTIEDEIREHELVAVRNVALEIKLKLVADKCDLALAKIRCARVIAFPLLSSEETRVWRAFLPMTYRWPVPREWLGIYIQAWTAYQFDEPPLSVLETLQRVITDKQFDMLELWTPERPMPEPIAVGWKDFDKQHVGPFLIARWGESLIPFADIKSQVDSQLRVAIPNMIQPVNTPITMSPFQLSTALGPSTTTIATPTWAGGSWTSSAFSSGG